jgi:septal ring factor EnvC (AmiA/AmiB activator)
MLESSHMKNSPVSIAVMMLLAAGSVSCDKFKPALPEMTQDAPAQGQANTAEGERTPYIQSAQTELDDLSDAIADFKAKAAVASRETKARLETDIEKLETELRAAQQRLSELKAATSDTWIQLKESFGKSLRELRSATEKFRKTSG